MAKAQADKIKEYRKRLTKNAGKTYSITLSPELAETMQQLGATFWPDAEPGDIIKSLTMAAFSRIGKIANEQQRLLVEFGADVETAQTYLLNEVTRQTPLTAEAYLNLIGRFDKRI